MHTGAIPPPLPNVKMILSGMSNMEQLMYNVKTFTSGAPLLETEIKLLYEIAEGMKESDKNACDTEFAAKKAQKLKHTTSR